MASLYNYSTKTYEPVDDREVTERVKAGQYTFQSGKKVKIRLPNGELYEIEPEKTQRAFKLGASFVTAEEEREIGLKEKYGQGWGNALSAFALGTLSGATLSGSNIALVESGIINKETLDAYRKYQSGAYIGGDITGSITSILATGGLATAAQAGVRGAKAANIAAHVLMPSAILAKGASAIGRGVTGAAAGNAAKLLAKGAGEGISKTRNAIVLGALAEGAVDAAGYATAEHLTEYYLGNPDKNAETFLGNFGMSTVLGGGLSALIPGVRHLAKPMSAEKSMDVLRYATGRFVDTSKGRVEVSQRLAEQENIPLDEAMQRTAANVDSALWRQSVDEDVLRYNDTLTDIKTAIEEKESFIERLTAERDLDLDDIGPALTEAKRRVDELTKKKADLDDTSALEDARRQAQEDTLSFRERYNREIEKQNLEVENLVAAKSQAQDTLFSLKQERDRIADEGKTMLSREIETQRDKAVGAVNQVYDLVEDGKALARGAHRNSVLVRGIESTTEEGTRGVDMIDAFYLEIANRRTQMENARGRPGVDSAEIDTVIGVLDAIEDEINDVLAKVGKFETNPVARVSKATGKKKTAEDLAREGQKADFRKAITSKAVDGPELDLAIKRAMFTTLDENRKVLGDIIFNHARDGKIAWNTQSLLKDTWLGFKVLQSHKSFGKAGEQIGQVTEAFSRLLEADQQFSSYFMAPKRFEREGRRYTDQDKLERFFGNPNKSHERKEGLNRYLQAANNLITISENAGLYAKGDDVVADVVDVQAVAEEAAQRYGEELSVRTGHVLSEVQGAIGDHGITFDLQMRLEIITERRHAEATERYLRGEMTPEYQDEVAREIEDEIRETLEARKGVDLWDEVLDGANVIQELRARYSLKDRAFPEEMPANDANLVSLTMASGVGDGGQLASKIRDTYAHTEDALNSIETSLLTKQVDDALTQAKSTAELMRQSLQELDVQKDWSTKDIWIEQNVQTIDYLENLARHLEENASALRMQSDKVSAERIAVDAYQVFKEMPLPGARMREASAPQTLAGKLARATRETNESMDEIGNLLEDTEALRAIKGGGRAVEPAGHPVHDSIRALQELSLREKDAGAALDAQIRKHRDAKATGRDLKASRLEELSQREQAEAAAQGNLEFEQARRAYEIGEVEDELAYTEAQAAILGRDAEGLKGTVEHYQNLERAGIADLKDMAYGRMPYEATGGPFGPKPKPTELQRPEAYLPRLPDSGAGAIGDLTASGTTSIPGLAMYQVGGWQGAALGSIGFSSVIQALRSGADPQRRWMAYLQAYDTMVRYQHNRKRIVSDFLSGELKKATVDRKASPFRLMLGSLMQFGEFEGLFQASSGDDFTDATARLHTINSKPELKMKILEKAVAGLDPSMPKHSAAIQKQLATCLDYLGEQCPKEPQTNLLALTRRSNWRPSDSQVYSFQTGCIEPLESQLETLQNGLAQRTITPRQVKTWQVCMPSFYADCAEDMYSGFAELKEPAPYDVRTVASVFLGSHVEPTRQTPFVQGMQGMFNQQAQPIGDAASATRGRSEAALTPSQERQQRIA